MSTSEIPTLPTGVNPAVSVMGGLFIEVFVACILYGVATLQTIIYYQNYASDKTFLKFLVATVWVLETVHTVFCIQFLYDYIIGEFGNYLNFLRVPRGVGIRVSVAPSMPMTTFNLYSLTQITVVCSACIALCVQGYYTWRVWIVSGKSIIWTAIIGTFALARVGFGIGSCVLCYIFPSWPVLRDRRTSLVIVSGGLGSAALVDILVALTLIIYLKRGSRSSGIWHKESRTMVNQILLYAVNTGAITGTASLTCVILFTIQKNSLTFLGLVEAQAKLYSNSFLGSLNARSHIRGKRVHPSSSSQSGIRVNTAPRPVLEVYEDTVVEDDRECPESANLALHSLKSHSMNSADKIGPLA